MNISPLVVTHKKKKESGDNESSKKAEEETKEENPFQRNFELHHLKRKEMDRSMLKLGYNQLPKIEQNKDLKLKLHKDKSCEKVEMTETVLD